MAKYAIVDSQGLPTAFFDEDVHGPREIPDPNWQPPKGNPQAKPPMVPNPDTKIPQGAILIPDADWQAHISGDLRRWDAAKKAWVKYTPPPPPLADVKAQAIAQLNAVAEQRRQKWLPAPGQALTYMEKERQARAYKAAGYTGQVPPLVHAEVTAGRYATAKAAADAIIAAADAARAALTQIEAERVAGIAAIQAAKDAAGVQAALQTAEQKIRAIK